MNMHHQELKLSTVTSSEGFALTCHECGRVTILDAEAQWKILAELKLPAQRKMIDCNCGKYQWVLAVRPKLLTASEVVPARV